MVLLTYRSDDAASSSSGKTTPVLGEGSVEVSENDNGVKHVDIGPKTAYIEKLGKFTEDDAEEEKCDLFFICNDGQMISAHRLVISNVSQLIQSMQDVMPPWHPMYISVPDLSKDIVQALVQLAYTGQMQQPSSASEEMLDAMHALGWISSDSLTATFIDAMNPAADDDVVSPVSTKSLEAALKKKFRRTPKRGTNASDDDDNMEVDLPEVPMSDEEEAKPVRRVRAIISSPKISPRPELRKTSPEPRGRAKVANKSVKKAPLNNASAQKKANTNQQTRSTRSKVEQSPHAVVAAQSKPDTPQRAGRKRIEDTPAEDTAKINKEPENEADTVNSVAPEAVRSRTRTIRKPKKFDDMVVEHTPTKRKDSPAKSPTKPLTKTMKTDSDDVSNQKPKNDCPSQIKAVSAAGNKRRKSTNADNKDNSSTPLITSYFKRGARKSEDSSQNSEQVNENDCDNGDPIAVNNVQNAEDSTKEGKKRVAEEKSNATLSNDVNTTNSNSTPRNRSKSTASSKSDKESETALEDGNHEKAPEKAVLANAGGPATRGRKSSTVSNASKLSNKDCDSNADNITEETENGVGPRRKRSRQD